MSIECFAVYLTAATDEHPVGYVVNNISCDSSVSPSLIQGQAAIADPDRAYPIGSIYPQEGS